MESPHGTLQVLCALISRLSHGSVPFGGQWCVNSWTIGAFNLMAHGLRSALVLYLPHLHVIAYLCFGGQLECHLSNTLSTGHLDLQGYVPDYHGRGHD